MADDLMGSVLQQELRKFWDQGSITDAKFRRIVTNGQINSIEDTEVLERIWVNSVPESVSQILQGITLQGDWRILEVGAGIGRLVRAFSLLCPDGTVTGVDISPQMVTYAKSYLHDLSNAAVLLNDGATLSMFENNKFDFCYSMICFQHIPDVDIVRSYLREIKRVLKPGGMLRLQVTKERPVSLPRRLARRFIKRDRAALRSEAYTSWQPERPVDFMGNRYTRKSLTQLLSETGLVPSAWHDGLGMTEWLWVTSVKPETDSLEYYTK